MNCCPCMEYTVILDMGLSMPSIRMMPVGWVRFESASCGLYWLLWVYRHGSLRADRIHRWLHSVWWLHSFLLRCERSIRWYISLLYGQPCDAEPCDRDDRRRTMELVKVWLIYHHSNNSNTYILTKNPIKNVINKVEYKTIHFCRLFDTFLLNTGIGKNAICVFIKESSLYAFKNPG